MEPNFKKIKLIIGLGNPGRQYKNTYHNIGFLALNYILKKLNIKEKPQEEKYFQYISLNSKYYLIFPKTYMNNSGLAVKEALKKFKTTPQNTLIIHDESDLIIGKFKYSFGSQSAGHHGIESIIKACNSQNFWRLRIGIKPSNNLKIKAGEIILKKIKKEYYKTFYFIFDKLTEKLIENIFPASDDLISENGKSIAPKP